MTIAEKIYDLRIQRGLSQEKLAELLEVSRQAISKWELGQAIPDVDNIIKMSELFSVSTDTILLKSASLQPAESVEQKQKEGKPFDENPIHLGSVYLVVKDFEKSVTFYEKLFHAQANNRCQSGNQFIEFYIDGKCIALMNEKNIPGHCTHLDSPYKFVQNYWVEDLLTEYKRLKHMAIGKLTGIQQANPSYYYFHLTDPDNNIIEITGSLPQVGKDICQSCGMKMQHTDYGRNADGSPNTDYCKYCYPNGSFGKKETMEEMIESNLQFLDENSPDTPTPEAAREEMLAYFPLLKRWQLPAR